MQKFIILAILAILAATVTAEGVSPVIRYDFGKISQSGEVKNCCSELYPAVIRGKFSVTKDLTLSLDGLTTGMIVHGSEKFNPASGMTYSIVYRPRVVLEQDQVNQTHDALFYKHKQFVFSRKRNMIYINFYTKDKGWCAVYHSKDIFIPGDTSFHHIAMTVKHNRSVEIGINQTEISVYFDGVPIGNTTFPSVVPKDSYAPIEIGCGSSFGAPWRVCGEIADPRIYDQVLSPMEIREIIQEQTLAKPGFRVANKITNKRLAFLEKFRSQPEYYHSLRNLALDPDSNVPWEAIATNPKHFLTVFQGKDSALTFLSAPGCHRFVSWYNRKAKREMLNWENRFFELIFQKDGKETAVRPDTQVCISELIKPVQKKNGETHFSIKYQGADLSANAEFVFFGDRLSWRITDVKSSARFIRIVSPLVKLQPFLQSGSSMVIPIECGRVLKYSAKENAVYSGNYPGCNATMQLLAVYDNDGGLFCSSGDPHGRKQELSLSSGSEGSALSFDRMVPPDGIDSATATMELFHGDWYDVGLCYRNLLDRINAPWWSRDAIGVPTPQWLKENCLFIRYDYRNANNKHFEQLRNYFGMPFAAYAEGWFERGGKYAYDIRMNSDFLEDIHELHKYGIRVQTYNNGRILQQYDRRGKETCFSKVIAPNVAIEGKSKKIEIYPDTFGPTYVICPGTDFYKKMIFDICTRFASQGVDGIYLDQIGCSTSILCASKTHGHKPADPDAWYFKGQRPALAAVREFWKEQKQEKWIATESNAEVCVRYCDLMNCWRWLFDDQVPLYQMIYAGRVQIAEQDRQHAEPESAYMKNAEEIAFAEQIERLQSYVLTSPLCSEYRAYVRRLMYLRRGMLKWFEDGMMDRPPHFAEFQTPIRRVCGSFGSKTMSRPPIISSAWTLRDGKAVILINSSDKPQKNKLYFTAGKKNDIVFYSSENGRTAGCMNCDGTVLIELAPRACMVVTDTPSEELDDAFRRIVSFKNSKDPFELNANQIPVKAPIQPGVSQSVVQAAAIRGAHVNFSKGQVDFIHYGVVYPGLVAFGPEERIRKISLMISAPASSEDGIVRIYVDRISSETLIAESRVAENFRTKSWKDFQPLSLNSKIPLAGDRKIFFCFYGNSMCNFRSWSIH